MLVVSKVVAWVARRVREEAEQETDARRVDDEYARTVIGWHQTQLEWMQGRLDAAVEKLEACERRWRRRWDGTPRGGSSGEGPAAEG